MEGRYDPTRHFDTMSRFAAALKDLPAQIVDHSYSYESFGSWALTIRYQGHPLRLVFDGQEDELRVERSASKKPPYSWSLAWRGAGAAAENLCGGPIMTVIRDVGAAPGSQV